MIGAQQDTYVVLTGDLKASRKLGARAEIQDGLKDALLAVNGQSSGAIVAKFMVVGGDGFQGILYSTEYLFDLYYSLFEHIGYRFYIGIGTGAISTNMSENVGEMDGESFHRSSDALGKVKRKGGWVAFDSRRKIDGVITSSWNLMADVIWNWSERQKEIILYYRKHGGGRDAVRSARGVSTRHSEPAGTIC